MTDNPQAEPLIAAVERVRRLHDSLNAETDLTSPDDQITRGAAARRIAAALDGWSALTPVARQAASTAPLAAGLPLVQGRCPACQRASLFLGSGGYVTCSSVDCPEPDAATTVLERGMADEAQQPETGAVADCPYGEGPGDGSGCIKAAGHAGDHVVTPGVAVVPCSQAVLHQPHIPHVWWSQPGMAYVQCPGPSPAV